MHCHLRAVLGAELVKSVPDIVVELRHVQWRRRQLLWLVTSLLLLTMLIELVLVDVVVLWLRLLHRVGVLLLVVILHQRVLPLQAVHVVVFLMLGNASVGVIVRLLLMRMLQLTLIRLSTAVVGLLLLHRSRRLVVVLVALALLQVGAVVRRRVCVLLVHHGVVAAAWLLGLMARVLGLLRCLLIAVVMHLLLVLRLRL